MANDNNNINNLVADSDNDPTTELESLKAPNIRLSAASTTDEDTFDFERLEQVAELSGDSIAALKSDINSRNESISRLQFDIEQLRSRWAGLEKEIRAREDLTDRLNDQLAGARKKLAGSEASLRERQSDIDSLRSSLKDKSSLISSIEKEARKLSEAATSGQSVIENLQKKVSEQKEHEKQNASLRESLTLRAGDNRSRLAEQDGIIISNRQEIRELKQQIARTEGYADELRITLREHTTSSGESVQYRQRLELSLEGAIQQIRELKDCIDNEVHNYAELEKQKEHLQDEFEREIRQIRLELDVAEKTLTGKDNLNEQLASDLFENQGYRQALESKIEIDHDESEKAIRDLTRKIKRANQSYADLERKIENKDNAIAALLNELATRSHTIESIGEIENVIHEIDGRMSDRSNDKTGVEKDRKARLLIGNVDGQELQFPLFKNRLTIGRTGHNDIQLKAQFISRRHAVIVTENERTCIIDWGSKNGVFVNDSRVSEQRLRNGDIVAIGTAEFRYEERPKR